MVKGMLGWVLRLVFATAELCCTLLVAAILYAAGAFCFAISIFIVAMRGTLQRGAALWRARVHGAAEPTLADAGAVLPDRGPAGRGRFSPNWN